MPKETFGGDDEGGAAVEEKKRKLDLSKYSKGPDMNIRDVFWSIVGTYGAKKGHVPDFSGLENDRFALVRVAIGAISGPSPLRVRLTPGHIARYSIMMVLDAGWQDCFTEFLEDCAPRESQRKAVLAGLKKIEEDLAYSRRLVESLRMMLRQHETSAIALRYAAELRSAKMTEELKKELTIFARGDIGENQLNAMATLAMLPGDLEVIKTMTLLLSHWDEAARKAAAEFLLKNRSAEGDAAAGRRLDKETDPLVRAVLEKIIKK